MRSFAAAFAALLLAGCVSEEGPMMSPGENCMDCHGGGGDGPTWTVAGTVYPSATTADPDAGVRGATISIRDSNGKSFDLRSNKAGNFYTAESLAFPIRVGVNGNPMLGLVTDGGCNGCHSVGQRLY